MSNTVTGLNSNYISIINSMMMIERQPLLQLQQKQDDVKVQKGVFLDLKSQLDSFQTSVRSLLSTNASYAMTIGRKAAVNPGTTGASVATATVFNSAVPGTYNLQVTTLAKEHRVRSARQPYSNQDLNLSGSFHIGGGQTRLANDQVTNATVSALTTTTVISGQKELGKGIYSVETRLNGDTWQFRLIDSDNAAVSILKANQVDVTSDWQDIPVSTQTPPQAVTFDTGRGLELTFSGDPANYAAGVVGSGAASVAYTPAGAKIDIDATDSLVDIASKINAGVYAEGNEVAASIIDNQLVLSAKNSGLNRTILASDDSGSTVLQSLDILNGTGSFTHQLQAPTNATFSVNGIPVTRSRNDGLTDVISGTTLSLAKDAEGKTAELVVTADLSGPKKTVDNFVSQFNSLQNYLKSKLEVVKQSDGTYKRGALTGDMMITNLRNSLFNLVSGSYTTGGKFTRLSDLGIVLDDGKISLKDASKLESALTNDFDGVKQLLDKAMSSFDTKLAQYTGSSSYVSQAITSSDRLVDNLTDRIGTMNTRLDARQAYLTQQYAQMQATLAEMENMQSTLSFGFTAMFSG